MSPLGKKVVPAPRPAEVEDEYEPVNANGTILRNKRTGQLETSISPKGPQYAPPLPVVVPDVPITTEQWDAMIAGLPEAIKQQIDDGYDPNLWGIM